MNRRFRRSIRGVDQGEVLRGALFGLVGVLLVHIASGALDHPAGMKPLYALPIWLATRLGGLRAGFCASFGTLIALELPLLALGPAGWTGSHLVEVTTSLISLAAVALLFGYLERSIQRGWLLAMDDSLTGLHNRRAADEFGRALVKQAKRQGRPLVALAVDCDNFKQINDHFGHKAGDKALKVLATALASNARGSDLVCRVGGDEFLVLLSGADSNWANKYVSVVRNQVYDQLKREPYQLSFSVGVSVLGRDANTFSQMLESADARMFRNKGLIHRQGLAAVQLPEGNVKPAAY